MIRVLLVDDQAHVRKGLRMRLELEPGFTVVGEAGDGEAAVRLATLVGPDVVVMDLEMPGMDELAATARLRECAPGVSVIVLSIYDDDRTRRRAAESGAAAFVTKHEIETALVAAIRAAADDSVAKELPS